MALASNLALRKPYYGWYIVALGFLAQFVVSGLRTFAISVFLKPMTTELAWTRGDFVGVLSLGLVIQGLLTPLVGPLLDRRGARDLMVVGSLLTGGSFIALGQVHALWQFGLVVGVIMPAGLLAASPMVMQVAIANWFIRKRGQALALAGAGLTLGGATLVPLAGFLIGAWGWRMAWVVLGLMTWLVLAPPSFLFIKRRPEDVGLAPDGLLPVARAGPVPAANPGAEIAWTRRQAMGTLAFWLLVTAFGLGSMSMVGWAMHVIPFITDLGFSTGIATSVMTVHLLAITLTIPAWGLLVDRFEARHLAIGACLLSAVALFLIFFVVPPKLAALYGLVILLGLGYGADFLVQPLIWANYYGRVSLGTVRSIGMFFNTAFSATGPLFAAYVFDAFRSYDIAFGVFAALWLVAALLIFVMRAPQRVPLAARAT